MLSSLGTFASTSVLIYILPGTHPDLTLETTPLQLNMGEKVVLTSHIAASRGMNVNMNCSAFWFVFISFPSPT